MELHMIITLVCLHLLLVYPVYLYFKWLCRYDHETKSYIGKWSYGDFYIGIALCFVLWELVLLIGAGINLIDYVENRWNEQIPVKK